MKMKTKFKLAAHGLGLYLGINALFQSRTPQGALAWFIGLTGFPALGIPLFVVFGRRRYHEESPEPLFRFPRPAVITHDHSQLAEFEQFLLHTGFRFTRDNTIQLLIDGNDIYRSMLDDLERAEKYIVLQVFIFRTDETGLKFADVLKRKARQGVKVYVLYEKVLIKMNEHVLKEMRQSGVHLGLFKPFTRNKFHLNFRNHRKILVVDGKSGFFGGMNIGDDYVGKYPQIGHWRDTNVRICGPALIPAQEAFARDWLASQGFETDIDWQAPPCEGDANILVFSSGPVEEKPMCLLNHIAMIELARKRLWIANPYIVPPQSLLDALAMAALRGVDVRILVPSYSDNFLITGVADIYYERLLSYGIRIFKYTEGFLHQKVMLVDNCLGVVGSANLDFRSMYINFEITTATSDKEFIHELEKMLENDLESSVEINLEQIREKPLFMKVVERGMNLVAPVL
jgi:cardiolipin synthase